MTATERTEKNEKTENLAKLILEGDQLLRSGSIAECVRLLNTVNTAQVEASQRSLLASFARRAGRPSIGLRILAPSVKAPDAEPSPKELAEYAVLLQRCGATAEAKKRLEKISPQDAPESLLYRAFCHFNLWEYEQALPLLKAYLEEVKDPYSSFVVKVNLADAFLALDRLEEAEQALVDLEPQTRKLKFLRLTANCLEMQAQVFVLSGQFPRAREKLNEALVMFSKAKTLDHFYVERWQAALDSFESKNEAALVAFRKLAQSREDSESIRQTDFLRLKVHFDPKLFQTLYFGTPHPAYRAKLNKAFTQAPLRDVLELGPKKADLIDIATAEINGAPSLVAGQLPHRVLEALTRDFYRPLSVGALHSEIFPNEYFDIFSSPGRVHQAIRRTKDFIEHSHLDIEIHALRTGYALFKMASPESLKCRLRISISNPSSESVWERRLHQLRLSFPEGGFTTREISTKLGMTLNLARRLCLWGVDNGRLEKFGASTGTRYYFNRQP